MVAILLAHCLTVALSMCAHVVYGSMKCLILVGLEFLHQEDLALVKEAVEKLLTSWDVADELADDGTLSTSSWSEVPLEPASEKHGESAIGTSLGTQSVCNHEKTTTQGSNAFQIRRRCKDCGLLLSCELTEAGHKAKLNKFAKQG